MKLLMKKLSLFIILVFIGWINVSLVNAHQFSTAHLQLTEQTNSQQVSSYHQGSLSLSLIDLQQTVGLDIDGDNQLKWGEIKASLASVHRYLTSNVSFRQDTKFCAVAWSQQIELTNLFGEIQLVMPLSVNCPLQTVIQLDYTAFENSLNQHKLLVTWQASQQHQTILDKDNQSFTIDLEKSNRFNTITFYIWQGLLHIWLGFDHLLFVFLLVLPFALNHTPVLEKSGAWSRMITNAKPILILVSGFTLAHSITLLLSVFDWIYLPSHWVEASIALSIVLTALNIIFKVVKNYFWITVAFGFLHGMGFAGALADLGLSSDYRIMSVLVFNLGVELGQLIFILVCLPLLYLIGRFRKLQLVLVPACATSIAVLGVVWIIERLN